MSNENFNGLLQLHELQFVRFSYDGRVARVVLEDDYEDEVVYTVSVHTRVVFSNIERIGDPCVSRLRVERVSISDYLPVDANGYYMPHGDPSAVMKVATLGLSSCIGQKADTYASALVLIGGIVYCTIPIAGPDGVQVERSSD